MAVTPAETVTTTSPAGAAEQMMPLTITHLVLIVLAMAATIVMIWWGSRLFRARKDVEDAMEDRGEIERVGETPADAVEAPPPEPVPAPSSPVVPAAVAPFTEAQPQPMPVEDTRPSVPVGSELTLLKGLGPKVAAQLEGLGIATVADMAALTPERAETIDAQLGSFRGRMDRDRWIEQARLLDRGDRAGYEAIFGKLDR